SRRSSPSGDRNEATAASMIVDLVSPLPAARSSTRCSSAGSKYTFMRAFIPPSELDAVVRIHGGLPRHIAHVLPQHLGPNAVIITLVRDDRELARESRLFLNYGLVLGQGRLASNAAVRVGFLGVGKASARSADASRNQ